MLNMLLITVEYGMKMLAFNYKFFANKVTVSDKTFLLIRPLTL